MKRITVIILPQPHGSRLKGRHQCCNDADGVGWYRTDFTERSETQSGGNGLLGSDETSENLSATLSTDAPTPNTP